MAKATALSNVAELLQEAAEQGRIVMVLPSRCTVPHGEPPLIVNCMLRFALTRAEGRLLGYLLQHGRGSKGELHAAMMSTGDPVRGKNVDVTVCRLRKRLAPYGVAVDTIRRLGFALGENARSEINRLLAEHGAGTITPAEPAAAPSD